jgi:hypothetical protein
MAAVFGGQLLAASGMAALAGGHALLSVVIAVAGLAWIVGAFVARRAAAPVERAATPVLGVPYRLLELHLRHNVWSTDGSPLTTWSAQRSLVRQQPRGEHAGQAVHWQ